MSHLRLREPRGERARRSEAARGTGIERSEPWPLSFVGLNDPARIRRDRCPTLHAVRHLVSAVILAPQEPVGNFVADKSLLGRIELECGVAHSVSDVTNVDQRRSLVAN